MTFASSLEQSLLNAVFGASAYSAPATLYVALSTGTQTASVVEPSGSSYARVAVTNNGTNWNTASGSAPATTSNKTTITFPTATGAWGTIQSFAIYDASSAGTLLAQGNLTVGQVINSGDTPSFAASALTITLS